MRAAEYDVVVADRVLEEIVREDSRIPHLQEHLGAAQVASVLVLKQFRLLTELTADLCGCLDDCDITLG